MTLSQRIEARRRESARHHKYTPGFSTAACQYRLDWWTSCLLGPEAHADPRARFTARDETGRIKYDR